MKKKTPHLSLVAEESDEQWHAYVQNELRPRLERFSDGSLRILEERIQQMLAEKKLKSPLRRQAKMNRIQTERAGKIKRIQ